MEKTTRTLEPEWLHKLSKGPKSKKRKIEEKQGTEKWRYMFQKQQEADSFKISANTLHMLRKNWNVLWEYSQEILTVGCEE